MHTAPLILIPKNGLGNRLRAIASGLSLARQLGRTLEVLWETRDGSAAHPQDLFERPEQFKFVSQDRAAFYGVHPASLPPYISDRPDLLSLRGYDRGEQFYIKDFVDRALALPERPLVIAAGNFFHPAAGAGARGKSSLDRLTQPDRLRLLTELKFNRTVSHRAEKTRPHCAYVGLHLRGTDRRKEASSPQRLLRTAISVANRLRITDFFICSDDDRLRANAARFARSAGFYVAFDPATPIRRDIEGEQQAAADFLNLMYSAILVGPRASTFSTEAAVGNTNGHHYLLARRTTGSARLDRFLRSRIGNSSRFW